MEWTVKFDKPDFIGRSGLETVRDRGDRNRLVGFVADDATVPEDGDPVTVDGSPVGRVRLDPVYDPEGARLRE